MKEIDAVRPPPVNDWPDPKKPDLKDLVGDEEKRQSKADLECPICLLVVEDPI